MASIGDPDSLPRYFEMETSNNRLVILDLDGTITSSDTLIPFLLGCFFRYPRVRLKMFLLPLDIISFYFKRITTTHFKERFLSAFVGGLKIDLVESWAKEFASRIVSSGCRKVVLDLIKKFQANGDRLIICSASPGIYVRFIAEGLGIAEVVSTEVEIRNGCFTGRLVGENCAGEEKLRRLKHYLRTEKYPGTALAYGDRKSDLAILKWVDEGWLLRGDKLIPAKLLQRNHP